MFEAGSTHFNYFDHPYNNTRINERTVEVPVALELMYRYPKVLEIGAVTPHYLYKLNHPVVDLYEVFPGVTNQDVLTYEPFNVPVDLVLSISTLDHLFSRENVMKAVERMKGWGKHLFITLPFGQPEWAGSGPWLDDLVLSGSLEMHVTRLDKTFPDNHLWEEVPLLGSPCRPYNGVTRFANTVFLLTYPQPLHLLLGQNEDLLKEAPFR